MDKFNRTNFYKTEVVDSITEKDLLTNTTKVFDNQVEYGFYSVTEQDLLRPDLIAFRFYGSVSYWWILMKANDIEDIWNDLYVGKILVIPSFNDIDKYYETRDN
jgi:hypothetical protein